MDIHMPDRSGLDILNHVTSGYPELRVLIMSGLPEEQYARNVLRAGASGYLSKGGSSEELLKAVRLALQGRRYVSASLAESMAAELDHPRDHHAPLHSVLSDREFQIFRKLAAGAPVTRIAEELSLSAKTVSTYRSRILEKTRFKSNAEMTAYALRSGLIL
jgi:two-component system, NarL family, invasion response regulator UvrY